MIYCLIPLCIVLLFKYLLIKYEYRNLEINYYILNQKYKQLTEKE